MKYIDISEHQGIIDFEKVKGNVDGVMIRAGYGKNHIDKYYKRNASECNRLSIPCGAYWFSYAKTETEAANEAYYLLDLVKPYRMELPLAYDFEYASVDNATSQGVKVTKRLASSFVHAFCQAIEKGGYWCLNYTNQDFLSRLYDSNVASRYGLWLAAWALSKPADLSKPPRSCAIWQWGGSSVPGINGNVDTNESYTDFPKMLLECGANHLTPIVQKPSESTGQTQTPKEDASADALAWAKSFKITDNAEIASALLKYHNTFVAPEDGKNASGLLS